MAFTGDCNADSARVITKQALRHAIVDRLHSNVDADVEYFKAMINGERVQADLGRYLEALAARSKKR
jgi:hypothetical protein